MERDEKRNYLVSLRESTGMTRRDFAIEYNIPYPTITDWELGHRRVPEYFLRLLAYRIEIEKGASSVQEKLSSDKTNLKEGEQISCYFVGEVLEISQKEVCKRRSICTM